LSLSPRLKPVEDAPARLTSELAIVVVTALVAGVTLPGDWGAFGSYLIGGSSLVVLAIGSTAPGTAVHLGTVSPTT